MPSPVDSAAADSVEIENRGGLSRTTCGWRKPELALEPVRRYWRDVHGPAIARRAGVYQYRHNPFDPVRPGLFGGIPGIEFSAPDDAQLQWQSDVVYADEAGMQAFMRSPADPAVTAQLLADIEMIVDQSTTYKASGENLHTYVDRIGDPAPQGPRPAPQFGLFLRRRADEPTFRAGVRELAERWSRNDGVLRLRVNLFDTPDMEAERKAGYPVKTHPSELQYQAWIEIVLQNDSVAKSLLAPAAGAADCADLFHTLHAYPVPAIYTFVFDGTPTIVGLRGYAAYEAIRGLGAENALDPRLLEWMYGPVVRGTRESSR